MVTISGVITPAHAAEVTIDITLPDKTVAKHSVVSDTNGDYTFEYTPTQIGIHKAVTSWDGDMNTKGAVSEEKAFEAKKKENSVISLTVEPTVVYIN